MKKGFLNQQAPDFDPYVREFVLAKQFDLLWEMGIKSSQRLHNVLMGRSYRDFWYAYKLMTWMIIESPNDIPNKEQIFFEILKYKWASKNSGKIMSARDKPLLRKALFRYWLDLASEYCFYDNFLDQDNTRYVSLGENPPEKFTDVWNRGITLVYLQSLMYLD